MEQTKMKIREGGLFTIKLSESAYAVGIILHVSRYFKGGILIGIFDQTVSNDFDFDQILCNLSFFDTPNYTGRKNFTSQEWTMVDYQPHILSQVDIPYLAEGSKIYYKDDVVELLSEIDDVKNYQRLEVQGRFYIEDILMDHFNIQ